MSGWKTTWTTAGAASSSVRRKGGAGRRCRTGRAGEPSGRRRIIIAGRDSAQDNINQAGEEMTRRSMNIQPTLTSRPGLPVRIIVARDLTLLPYQPLMFNRGTSR
ncbi:TrbI/VirB10 family protein [Paracoccus kondratievae]